MVAEQSTDDERAVAGVVAGDDLVIEPDQPQSSPDLSGDELGFASGDLGRIQGILLGDHARRIDNRLAELRDANQQETAHLAVDLESAVQRLTAELSVLRADLSEERTARLDAARLASEERAHLSQEIEELRRLLAEARTESSQAVNDLGDRVDVELEGLGSRLTDQKVDRVTLVELLRDTAVALESPAGPDGRSGPSTEA